MESSSIEKDKGISGSQPRPEGISVEESRKRLNELRIREVQFKIVIEEKELLLVERELSQLVVPTYEELVKKEAVSERKRFDWLDHLSDERLLGEKFCLALMREVENATRRQIHLELLVAQHKLHIVELEQELVILTMSEEVDDEEGMR